MVKIVNSDAYKCLCTKIIIIGLNRFKIFFLFKYVREGERDDEGLKYNKLNKIEEILNWLDASNRKYRMKERDPILDVC